jgi:hypothetical protein
MNYTELKAAITSWAHRSDVSAQADTFIALAEAEFNTRLRTVDQETVAELVCNTRYTALPDDFLELRAVEFEGDTISNLTYATPEFISEWRRASPSGDSKAYTLRGLHIELLPNLGADDPDVDGFGDDVAPFQSGEVPITLHYWAKIPALSALNLTNWLINAHPNLYLYACLRNAAIWTKDDRGIERYTGLLQGEWDAIQRKDVNRRFGGSALFIRAA